MLVKARPQVENVRLDHLAGQEGVIHCISLRWAEAGLVWRGAGQKVWQRGKAGQPEARAGISSTLSCCRTSSPRAFLHSLLTPNPCWPYPGREADAHWPERCGSNHHHCLAGKLRPSEEVRPINDWSRAGSTFWQASLLFFFKVQKPNHA